MPRGKDVGTKWESARKQKSTKAKDLWNQGLTTQEIATNLGCSLSAINKYLVEAGVHRIPGWGRRK